MLAQVSGRCRKGNWRTHADGDYDIEGDGACVRNIVQHLQYNTLSQDYIFDGKEPHYHKCRTVAVHVLELVL
jgi:hypothetical protein